MTSGANAAVSSRDPVICELKHFNVCLEPSTILACHVDWGGCVFQMAKPQGGGVSVCVDRWARPWSEAALEVTQACSRYCTNMKSISIVSDFWDLGIACYWSTAWPSLTNTVLKSWHLIKKKKLSMLQIHYKNEEKLLCYCSLQILHGLIFGKQDLVFRGASKKLCEHAHDNGNFIHLAEATAKFDNIMAECFCII